MTTPANQPANRRFELRAYASADAVRAAAIITSLNNAGEPLTRDALAAEWGRRHPRHLERTGRRALRTRLSNALSLLAIAGTITRHDDGSVSILDADRLGMAARNLSIIQDADGQAVPPSAWARRPEAPAHLADVQAELEARP